MAVADQEEQIGSEVSGVWHGVYFSFAVAIVRRGQGKAVSTELYPGFCVFSA